MIPLSWASEKVPCQASEKVRCRGSDRFLDRRSHYFRGARKQSIQEARISSGHSLIIINEAIVDWLIFKAVSLSAFSLSSDKDVQNVHRKELNWLLSSTNRFLRFVHICWKIVDRFELKCDGELTMGLAWSNQLLVMLPWIPAVSWLLRDQRVSAHLWTNQLSDWAHHYGNQSRGYFNYGRPLWPPAVPRLATRPSQSNPRGSGPEVVKRERGHVTSETWSLWGGGLQGPPA